MKTGYEAAGAASGKDRVRKDAWIWGGWSEGSSLPALSAAGRSSGAGAGAARLLGTGAHRRRPDAAREETWLQRFPGLVAQGRSTMDGSGFPSCFSVHVVSSLL